MAKSAAQKFKERRVKMKDFNEGRRINPNAPVNELTSKEFDQLQRNRDENYNRKIGGALSIGRPIGATTLGIMKYGGKGIDNVKRIFAPSDKEIMQNRLKKNYRNLMTNLNKPTVEQFIKNQKRVKK